VRRDASTPVPAPVLALAGGAAVRPVWVNERGGITFEIGTEDRRRFVKWAPAASAQTKADRPVMARPTTRVLISRVPS
jgi:kanamycin kinase